MLPVHSTGTLYSLQLLHVALIVLARAITPLIGGIILIGILIALIQGAFQVEDGALAMGAKIVVVFAMASSGGVAIYLAIEHLAASWISHIPQLLALSWS